VNYFTIGLLMRITIKKDKKKKKIKKKVKITAYIQFNKLAIYLKSVYNWSVRKTKWEQEWDGIRMSKVICNLDRSTYAQD